LVFLISLFAATENKDCLCVLLLISDSLFAGVNTVTSTFQVINKKISSVHEIYIVSRIILKGD